MAPFSPKGRGSVRAPAASSAALVHLFAFNGLRITEARKANVDDLVHDRGHAPYGPRGRQVARAGNAPVTSRALDA